MYFGPFVFRFRIQSILLLMAVSACASLWIRRHIEYGNARAQLNSILSDANAPSPENMVYARRIIERFPALSKMRGVVRWAAAYGDYETLNVILERGGDANEPAGWNRGSPLVVAITRKDARLVECLLKHGADPLRPSEVQSTPTSLLSLACQSGSLEIAKILMRAGVNVNARGSGEGVPLHYAAASGNPGLVRFLLQNGADTKARDSHGFTPEEYVSICMRIAVVNRQQEVELALDRARDEFIYWESNSRTEWDTKEMMSPVQLKVE